MLEEEIAYRKRVFCGVKLERSAELHELPLAPLADEGADTKWKWKWMKNNAELKNAEQQTQAKNGAGTRHDFYFFMTKEMRHETPLIYAMEIAAKCAQQ